MATALAPGFHFSGTPGANKLTPKQVMALARKYGLPARGIMQIAKGESGLDASVQQRDPGDRMVGYGLLQMTPNAWGPAAKAHLQKLGGVKALSDPEVNMAMARYLYKAAGNSFKPWYGTRYLTDRSGEGTLGKVRGGVQIPGLNGGGGGAGAQSVPSGALNVTQLLSTLGVGSRPRPAITPPSAPAFSATAPVPESYQAVQSSGAPERTDYASALQTLAQVAASSRGSVSSNPGESMIGTAAPTDGSRAPNKLYELFWNGPGATNVKDGQRVGKGFVSGHTDHVHVASNQKALLRIGALAQRMGLRVGENPAFGGVDPVHVTNSYHYGRTRGREHDRAIDVSGSTAAMEKFARRVARIYGV